MYQKTKQVLIVASVIAIISGCASQQQFTKFAGQKLQKVCIAEHKAVRAEVLETIQEGFKAKGSTTQVIAATYEKKHALWVPTINPEEVVGCDVIVFYVANWSWDLAMYMSFANIWVTDRELNRNIAGATYQAGIGLDKFINAEKKILELVDGLFVNG